MPVPLKKILFFGITFLPARIFRCISYLVPRRKNIWAYGIDGGFRENTKYFYLWMNKNHPEITSVWFTTKPEIYNILKKRGLKVVYRYSFVGFFYAIRAKVYVSSHRISKISYAASGGCFYVELWHGIGLKRAAFPKSSKINWTGSDPYLGFSNKFVRSILRFIHANHFVKPDLFLATTEKMVKHFSLDWDLKEQNIMRGAYPRLEIFFNKELVRYIESKDLVTSLDSVLNLNTKGFSSLLLYMPTFREGEDDFFAKAIPNLEVLNKVLQNNNALFVVKFHPSDHKLYVQHKEKIAAYPNMCIWPIDQEDDFYPYLPLFRTLITDYSSILYDVLFFEKMRLIIYSFDYKEYIEKSRGLAFAFEENVTGMLIKDFDSFLVAVNKSLIEENSAQEIEDKKSLIDQFWGRTPEGACKQIYDEIIGRLEKVEV